jgi:solute carrier family 25 (mitochondrial thiamine pyrophosphate transporter), member 19
VVHIVGLLLRGTACADVQVYKGLTAAARGIVEQHGVRGLYRGLGITMIEIVPYSALQFGLYDSLNAAYNRVRVRQRSVSYGATQ